MCTLTDAGSSTPHDIAAARTILRRIARYRAGRPPTYPAEYLAVMDEAPKKKLEACLDVSLASPE